MAISALAICAIAVFSKEIVGKKAASPDPESVSNYWKALAMIPFAKAILTAVPAKTELAILTLIEHCHAIKNKSGFESNLVQQADADMSGYRNNSSLAALVQALGKSFETEVLDIQNVVEAHHLTIERLNAMESELSASVEMLCGIKEITERSTLITRKIADASAKSGISSTECVAIIEELQELNEHSSRYSQKAGKMLELLLSFSQANIKAIISEGDQEFQRINSSFLEISGQMDQLHKITGETIQEINIVAKQAKEIDGDVQALLESLQFQDITRQMVEGAVDILNDMSEHLLIGAGNPTGSDQNQAEIVANFQQIISQKLIDRSKTVDEKIAIAGVLK